MKKFVFILFLFKTFAIFSKDTSKLYFSPYIDFGHLGNQSLQLGTIVESRKSPFQIGIGLIGTFGFFNENNHRNTKKFDSKYFEHKNDRLNGLGYIVSLRYMVEKFKISNFVHSIGFQQSLINMKFYENEYVQDGPFIVNRLNENIGKINHKRIFYYISLQTPTRLFFEISTGLFYSFSTTDSIIREYRDYSKYFWDFGYNGIGTNIAIKLGYKLYKNKDK